MNHPNPIDDLPAYGQDIFNYLSANTASNHQLHMILSFNGQLRQNILAKAIRITMDIEPVLGCNFADHSESPYFKRRIDLDSLDHCLVYESENPDTDLNQFVALPIDSKKDPLVQAQIFRTKTKDILCIKLDHTVSDGGGLKEYIYLLAKVYTHLCSHFAYSISEKSSRRDCTYILKYFGIDNPLKAWYPSQSSPLPAWSFPSLQYKNQPPSFSMRQVKAKQLLILKAVAKKYEATINDILLTAYYRALFKITAAPENKAQPISVSADLRHYIPNKVIVANVSSSFNSSLTKNAGESFINTLKRVTQNTAKLKQNHSIVLTALFFEFIGSLNFSEAKKIYETIGQQNRKVNTLPPFLSNIGIINPIRFGDLSANEGYVVTPAMFAPLFMLGASTYNNVLTIIVNHYNSDNNQKTIESFLDSMLEDLEAVKST